MATQSISLAVLVTGISTAYVLIMYSALCVFRLFLMYLCRSFWILIFAWHRGITEDALSYCTLLYIFRPYDQFNFKYQDSHRRLIEEVNRRVFMVFLRLSTHKESKVS